MIYHDISLAHIWMILVLHNFLYFLTLFWDFHTVWILLFEIPLLHISHTSFPTPLTPKITIWFPFIELSKQPFQHFMEHVFKNMGFVVDILGCTMHDHVTVSFNLSGPWFILKLSSICTYLIKIFWKSNELIHVEPTSIHAKIHIKLTQIMYSINVRTIKCQLY